MLSLISAMTAFSLSMSLSPGPVNIAIASFGARYGVRRTLPFVSGATLGFTLLLVAVGLSYEWFVGGMRPLMVALQLLGAVFIAWMGWKIASAGTGANLDERAAPTFMEGCLSQWTNPKAWIACAAGAALFSRAASPATFGMFAAVYFAVCYLSLGAWAMLGHRMASLLTSHSRVRLFNRLMGGLLIVSAAAMALPRLSDLVRGGLA